MSVDGKSYAAGRTIYEAQNQAAVSGACALEILHRLDDLAQKAKPGSHSEGPHIVFSVYTQGPIHELWVHYTTEEDGDRIYHNQIWKSCNMGVECEVPGFLEAIDNVMRWGLEGHLEKIVNQLKLVWAAALPSSDPSSNCVVNSDRLRAHVNEGHAKWSVHFVGPFPCSIVFAGGLNESSWATGCQGSK